MRSRPTIRPGLKSRNLAHEPDAEVVLRAAAAAVSEQMGFELNINNPTHLGLLLEFACADLLAGITGNRLSPPVPARFPGNWVKPSSLDPSKTKTQQSQLMAHRLQNRPG